MSVIASQFSVTGITSMIPITVSPTGYIYTQDYNSKEIRVLSLSGTQITTISTTDWYSSFCVDYINNKIYCAGVNTFGTINLSNNTFSSFSSAWINGIAFGTDGYVYATTNSGYKIQKITPSTGAQTNIFTGTSGGNIKSDSYGIFGTCAFDNDGFLYCITRGVGYIYKFTTSGTLLGLFATTNNIYQYTFGFTYDTTNNVFYALATGTPGAVYKIDKYGSSSLYATGITGNAYGIFYDKVSAKVYAAAQTSSMIYIINPFIPPTGTNYSLSTANLLNYYPFNTNVLNYADPNNPVNDTTSNLVAISTATTILNNGIGTGSLGFPGTTNNWLKINKLNFPVSGITISVWAKYNSFVTSSGYERIFDFGNGGGSDGIIFGIFSGGRYEFFANMISFYSEYILTDYNWHNYCIVIDKSFATKIYMDGAIMSFRQSGSGPIVTSISGIFPTSKDLLSNFIGNSSFSPNESLNGYINNFMIFNRLFTDVEIAKTSNIYNNITFNPPASYPVSKEQLLCYYKFDADYLNYATSSTGVSDASASGVSITANALLLPGTSTQSFKLPTIKFGAFGLTIAFWMKCATIPTNWARIFDFATTPDIYSRTNNFYMGFPTTGAMQIKFNMTSLGTTSDVFDLKYTLADTNWHHYVLSISNIGTVAFYVDGSLIPDIYYNVYPTLAPFITNYIGKSPVSTDGYLNASFNQFYVFNRVITANEITMLSDSRLSIVPVTTVLQESYTTIPAKLTYSTSTSVKYSYSNPYLVPNAQYSLYNGDTLIGANTYTGITKGGEETSCGVDDSGNAWFYITAGGNTNYFSIYTSNLINTGNGLLVPNFTGDVWNRTRFYNGFIYLVACSGYAGTTGLFTVVNPYTKQFVYTDTSNIYADFDFGNDGYMYAVSATWRTNPRGDAWRVDRINLQTFEKTTIINGTATMFGSNSTDSALISIAFDSDDNMYIGSQTRYISKWSKSGVQLMAPIQLPDPYSTSASSLFDCDKATNTLYIKGNFYIIAANTTTFQTSIYAITATNYGQTHPSVDNRFRRLYFGGYRFDLNNVPTISFTGYLNNISTLLFQVRDASGNAFGNQLGVSVEYPCFLQGSKILRLDPETDEEEYVAVERLQKGDLIRTATCGYKAVAYIGRGTLKRPTDDPDPKNRLYGFRDKQKRYPPLFITGEHCLLYKKEDIRMEKRREVIEHMGDDYITEIYHRVPACLDDNGTPYVSPSGKPDGSVTIWHFALEHNNLYNNYAVYANGILVETCSIDFLTNHTSMVLV